MIVNNLLSQFYSQCQHGTKMSDRRQVLLIGESNIRKVVQTKEMEEMEDIEHILAICNPFRYL